MKWTSEKFVGFVIAWSAVGMGAVVPEAPRVDHVLIVSVDGLRSDALMALPPREIGGFMRLLRGAFTLNARTDADSTVTLPNHISMMTGRTLTGPGGHGWSANDRVAGQPSLHSVAGGYVSSVFDVAHDHGLYTAAFVTKEKMLLIEDSWGTDTGPADAVPPDDGRNKISWFTHLRQDERNAGTTATALTDAVIRGLTAGGDRSLLLVHYSDLDYAGHASGWDLTSGSTYLDSLKIVSGQLERILGAIEQDQRLRGRTAILLTADHGGGAPHRSHTRPEMWVNYIIPVLVWIGDDAKPNDLYATNWPARQDPGLHRPSVAAPNPPIRNGDVANLALDLLGLPAIPGSNINAGQDLEVQEQKATEPAAAPGRTPKRR